MAFPASITPPTSEQDVQALIAKAAQQSDGREAMHFAQAALNAAQAMHTLKFVREG